MAVKQGFLGDERDKVHKQYTSHAKKSSDNYGMTAMFVCNSAEDYENSQWTGQDIFNGMISVYTGAYVLSPKHTRFEIGLHTVFLSRELSANLFQILRLVWHFLARCEFFAFNVLCVSLPD